MVAPGPRVPCALVVNDDGIAAEGLRRLAIAAVNAGLDVIVAAPMREFSGSSASITAIAEGGHVLVEPRRLPGLDHTPTFAVNATPALITLIATRGAFGRVPDVVLSGINRGANVGAAVLHSGTVGAALTASITGRRAMAVSLDLRDTDQAAAAADHDVRHWDVAASIAMRVLPTLMDMPDSAVLNLNVPDLPAASVRGLRRAALSRFGRVQVTEVEKGSGLVRITLEDAEGDERQDTDLVLVADDYATLTPLRPVGEADLLVPLTNHAVPNEPAT